MIRWPNSAPQTDTPCHFGRFWPIVPVKRRSLRVLACEADVRLRSC
jgi:hypothetical protein